MAVTLADVPVRTPRYRHTSWTSTNKDMGRPEELIRIGKWWYITGNYNRVEDVNDTEYTREHLTRFSGLAADSYALDTTWNPAPNARTYAAAASADSTILYVGGAFTSIAGSTRNGLAAFNVSGSQPTLTSFFSGLAGGTVQALAVDGSGNIWVGGTFTSIAGSSRSRLAVFSPAGALQALNVACSQTVLDLRWDATNSQMIVLMRSDGTIGGGSTCKVAAVTTGGAVNWRANPNPGTTTFQADVDGSFAYVATNGDNHTYQYDLADGSAGNWTSWNTDGNNQGVCALGGNVFITHHGDFCATGPNLETTPTSAQGIIAVAASNGALQSWRPRLLYNSGDPYGGGVLKGFKLRPHLGSKQLCIGGDFTRVVATNGTQVVGRRITLFNDVSNPSGVDLGEGPPPETHPPTITNISPTSGPVGTQVIVTGTNLDTVTSVRFAGLSAPTFSVQTGTQLTATVPPAATSGVVGVTNPDGSANSSQSFTVTATPPPAGTVNDPFTRANTNSTMGTEPGTGNAYTYPDGMWGIDANRAYCYTSSTAYGEAVVNPGVLAYPYDIDVDIRTSPTTNRTNAGVAFHAKASRSDGMWFAKFEKTAASPGGLVGIGKHEGGTATNYVNVACNVTPAVDTLYHMKVTVGVSVITVRVTGPGGMDTTAQWTKTAAEQANFNSTYGLGLRVRIAADEDDLGSRWDNLAVSTGTVEPPPPPPPPPAASVKVIVAADFGPGNGRLDDVGRLVADYYNAGDTWGFLGAGDANQVEGRYSDFIAGIDMAFGNYMKKGNADFFYPIPGGHDYGSWGTANATTDGMTGYETYLRDAQGLDIGPQGLYYDVKNITDADGNETNWVLLRTNIVDAKSHADSDGLLVAIAAGSTQNSWLRTALAAIRDAGKCALVLESDPFFTSPSNHGREMRAKPLFDLLDQYLPGRAIIFSGNNHFYERFAPQNANAQRDNVNGNVFFLVGTGGVAAYSRTSTAANSLYWQNTSNGVLELELFADHANFRFVNVPADPTINDSGTITMNVTVEPPPPPPPGGGGYVSASSNGAAGATVAVTRPTGVEVNSILVAAISLVGGDSIASAPSGFTAIPSGATAVGSGGTTKVYKTLYQKQATTADVTASSYSFSGVAGTDSIFVNLICLAPGSVIGTPAHTKSSSTSAMDIDATSPDFAGLTVGDDVLVFTGADWGPRPWADTGCLLGFMPSESTGDPVNGAGITRLEGLIGRDIAVGHSMYPQPGTDLAVQGTFPENAGSATGVTNDWEHGRMSFISWPRQEAWLNTGGDQTPGRAQHLDFQDIANGVHDAKIASWALKLKAWGQPTWFRPFWEMNGGDPPWAVGYEASGDVPAWSTAFKNAWRRIRTIMVGTQSEVAGLSPIFTANSGVAPHCENLFFTWNPQEFESSANTSYSRDSHWPGSAYSEAAATELYLSPGDTAPQKMTNTGGGGFGGITHKAFYSEYAGVQGRLIATGEGGNRWQGSADTAAAIARTQSFTTMFRDYPAHKAFMWWDGGSTTAMGQSALAGKPTDLRNAEDAFFNDATMNPTLNVTARPNTRGWTVATQGRVPVGKAGTRYGPNQLGTTVYVKTAAAASMEAPDILGYGYGRFITTTLPIGTGSVVPTNPATVTSFSPASGPVGTVVNVYGTNFDTTVTAARVTFNGTPCTTMTRISSTQLRVNVPAGATTGAVSVTNDDGTGWSTSSFTVTTVVPPGPPTITGMSPTTGAIGTAVTLTGTNLDTVTAVDFHGLPASYTPASSATGSLVFIVPFGATTGTVTVTNASGSATSATYTVVASPPLVSSFIPESGPTGTQVTVYGSNFTASVLTAPNGVYFNGVRSGTLTLVSDTELRANVPVGATTGPISVRNADGIGESANDYTVTIIPEGIPTISSISPTSGAPGAEVAIFGTNLQSVNSVRFNFTAAAFTTYAGGTQLTAVVPDTATSGTIVVTNPYGSATSQSFTVLAGPPPPPPPPPVADGSFYWRVAVRDAAGNVSAWSDTAHVYVSGNGALTINSPTNAVEDPTPVISTTLSGRAQAAIAYILTEKQYDGTWREVWRQRRMAAPAAAGVAYEFTVPRIEREPNLVREGAMNKRSPIRKRDTDYHLQVRSWDSQALRQAVPGNPTYVSAEVTFRWQGSAASPAPTIGLTATPVDAGVVLEWSRVSTPTYWLLMMDGEVVSDRADALDWRLGGSAYRITFYGAPPLVEHEFEVVAVTETGDGKRHSSINNPTAVATTTPIGIWLSDRNIGTETDPAQVVRMIGQPSSPANIGQSAETFYPVGRRDPVTVVDSVRGYEDRIDGAIIEGQADLDTFEEIKGATGAVCRLAMGTMNIPVEIGEVAIARDPIEKDLFTVSFDVTQTDEFDIPQRVRGD